MRIRDLNLRAKSITLLEENVGEKFYDVAFGTDLLDMTSKTQAIKEGNRIHHQESERQPKEWQNICESCLIKD